MSDHATRTIEHGFPTRPTRPDECRHGLVLTGECWVCHVKAVPEEEKPNG